MKVTGWTTFENNDYFDLNDATEDEFQKMWQTVIDELKTKGYKINGFQHQNGYAPVIDDKWIFTVSFRTWGALMREAYDLPNEDGMGYCLWAWGCPKNEVAVLPEEDVI